MMQQIIYVSSATVAFDKPALLDLLSECRTKNERAGITGLLLYKDGHFLQVIEGDEDAVAELFTKIQADTRHQRVLTMLTQFIERRDFPDWSMAFHDLTKVDLKAYPGASDFLSVSFTDPAFVNDRSRAARLVSVFIADMR